MGHTVPFSGNCQHLVSQLDSVGLATGQSCHSLTTVAIVRSVIGRFRRRKEKKNEIALFDSLQPLILTIKGLSAEETCVVPEGHSYRKCAPVISRPRHQTIRRNWWFSSGGGILEAITSDIFISTENSQSTLAGFTETPSCEFNPWEEMDVRSHPLDPTPCCVCEPSAGSFYSCVIPLKYEHLLHSWLNGCNQDDVLFSHGWRRAGVCLIGCVLVGRRERSLPLDTERHLWPWKQKVTEQSHLKVRYWAGLVLYSCTGYSPCWLRFPQVLGSCRCPFSEQFKRFVRWDCNNQHLPWKRC